MRPWLVSATLFAALGLISPALAQPAAKTALTVDIPNDAATLDPQLQWDTDSYSVYRNIFDNLVTRDDQGNIVPQVAKAWHYADPTSLVFDLHDDIRFQDGTKLTANDVAFSIRRIIDPALRSPQLSQFDQITSVDVTSPTQVVVHTKTSYPVLLAQLVKLSILPEAYVRKLGNDAFNQMPMGSGPYRLGSWQHGVQTVLTANEAYWRGKPPFQTVTFRVVPDDGTRMADLRSGRADLVRQITPDDAQALKSAPGLQVLATPTERVGYLSVNALAGPARDVRVRRAIAMAIDRDTIISALLEGYAKPVNVVLTPASFGYTPDIKAWPFDPAQAKSLIQQAGATGATLTFLTSPAYDRRIVEAIQQMLGDVGLKVDIAQLDQPGFLKRRQGPPEDAGTLALGRWSCACQDADGTIFPLFRSGSLWSKYANPAYDKEVDEARTLIDPAQRMAAYHRAFTILHDDVPGVGLYQDYAIYGASSHLRWTPTPNEAFFVFDMRWQP